MRSCVAALRAMMVQQSCVFRIISSCPWGSAAPPQILAEALHCNGVRTILCGQKEASKLHFSGSELLRRSKRELSAQALHARITPNVHHNHVASCCRLASRRLRRA